MRGSIIKIRKKKKLVFSFQNKSLKTHETTESTTKKEREVNLCFPVAGTKFKINKKEPNLEKHSIGLILIKNIS